MTWYDFSTVVVAAVPKWKKSNVLRTINAQRCVSGCFIVRGDEFQSYEGSWVSWVLYLPPVILVENVISTGNIVTKNNVQKKINYR